MNTFTTSMITLAVIAVLLYVQATQIDALHQEVENSKVEAKIKEAEYANKVFETNQTLIFKHAKDTIYESPDYIGKHTIDF